MLNGFPEHVTLAFFLIILILVAWSIVWKGLALWKAARLYHRGWFIALLLINTLGLLEIFYIFVIARKAEQETSVENSSQSI